MSCFARGRKTTPRTAKQTTGISEMLDSANGCAAAQDAALDPNWDNAVTRNCTGISLILHFSGALIPSWPAVLSLPKSEETEEVLDDFFKVPDGINILLGKKSAKKSGKYTAREHDKYRQILTIWVSFVQGSLWHLKSYRHALRPGIWQDPSFRACCPLDFSSAGFFTLLLPLMLSLGSSFLQPGEREGFRETSLHPFSTEKGLLKKMDNNFTDRQIVIGQRGTVLNEKKKRGR